MYFRILFWNHLATFHLRIIYKWKFLQHSHHPAAIASKYHFFSNGRTWFFLPSFSFPHALAASFTMIICYIIKPLKKYQEKQQRTAPSLNACHNNRAWARILHTKSTSHSLNGNFAVWMRVYVPFSIRQFSMVFFSSPRRIIKQYCISCHCGSFKTQDNNSNNNAKWLKLSWEFLKARGWGWWKTSGRSSMWADEK